MMIKFHYKSCRTCENNLIKYEHKRKWNERGKEKKRNLVTVNKMLNVSTDIKSFLKRKKPNFIFIPVKRLSVTHVLGNSDKRELKQNSSYLSKNIYTDREYGNQREQRVELIEVDTYAHASYFFKSCKDEEDFNDIENLKKLTKNNEISKYKKHQ